MAKRKKRILKKGSIFTSMKFWIPMIIVMVLGIITVLVMGNFLGNFDFSNLFKFTLPPLTPEQVTMFEQESPSASCTFTFNTSEALVGELVRASITDGELKRCIVAYDYEDTGWKIYNVETLDVNGEWTDTQSADVPGTYVFAALCGHFEDEDFILECRTNDDTVEIIPLEGIGCTDSDGLDENEPGFVTDFRGMFFDDCFSEFVVKEYYCKGDTGATKNIDCADGTKCIEQAGGDYCLDYDDEPAVGDVVDESTGDGKLFNGEEKITTIDVENWVPGGPFILGAKIYRSWTYEDPQDPDCGNGFPEVVEWTFWDSNGLRWQVYDEVPTTKTEDVCPVVYHPDASWKFEVRNSQSACNILYEWKVEAYLCEGG